MKYIKIKSDTKNSQIKNLYETAFPKNEQIPWKDLLLLIDSMKLDFTAYYENDIFLGFTIVYPRNTFNWFWYFAVEEKLRGKGIGQKILDELKIKYSKNYLILDMESPEQECENLEQRKRRHNFYLRNGFKDTGVKRTFDKIEMTIMSIGDGVFTQKDYDLLIDELKVFWNNMPKF